MMTSMNEETQEKVDFKGLVAGLATSAVAVLSQVESLLSGGPTAQPASAESQEEKLSPEEVQKRVRDGLAGARQLIDTLAVLEAKTQGNLMAEEQELLSTALSELRLRFVSLSNRSVSKQEGEAG
jgi:hypothetical protein